MSTTTNELQFKVVGTLLTIICPGCSGEFLSRLEPGDIPSIDFTEACATDEHEFRDNHCPCCTAEIDATNNADGRDYYQESKAYEDTNLF